MRTAESTAPASAAPIEPGERIELVDALRGFALLGILLVNMASFKSTATLTTDLARGLPDQVATWLIAFLAQTKFYVLFSFLFGYGLSVQMARAARRGEPLIPRSLRRLLALLVIGLAHGLLLYIGDILVTYALLGVVLLLLRNAADRALLRLAAALVATTVLLLLIGAGLVALAPPGVGADLGAELRAEAARTAAAYRGAPAEVIAQRAREYPGTLAFALLGQGPTALAMFLTGLWAGRQRLFERVDAHLPLLRRVLALGALVGVPGALVWATYYVRFGFAFDAGFLVVAAIDFATAPLLSAVYLTALTLAYRSPTWRRRLASLAPVGRLALTNYLLQSLAGALIFTGYGLGLYGQVGSALGLLLSLLIFAAQIPLSAWWLRRFDFGPAEWALRSFTYGRAQPLRTRTGTGGSGAATAGARDGGAR